MSRHSVYSGPRATSRNIFTHVKTNIFNSTFLCPRSPYEAGPRSRTLPAPEPRFHLRGTVYAAFDQEVGSISLFLKHGNRQLDYLPLQSMCVLNVPVLWSGLSNSCLSLSLSLKHPKLFMAWKLTKSIYARTLFAKTQNFANNNKTKVCNLFSQNANFNFNSTLS